MITERTDKRTASQIRTMSIDFDVFGYADASVLFRQGNTVVLASVSLQNNVPPFLKGQKVGWLSAEYAMLPAATHQRTNREATRGKQNGRTVEISRLIGRCLRPTVNLDALGERTITVDCDVLQADGGTRVACITAASLALRIATNRWIERGITKENILKEQIAALSVGVVKGGALCDLSYVEDSQAEADFNFVMTGDGRLIEIQGTSEQMPLEWEMFLTLQQMALAGIKQILDFTQKSCTVAQSSKNKLLVSSQSESRYTPTKKPFFSLGSRISK